MPIDYKTFKALAKFLLDYAGGTLQAAVQSALSDEVKGKLNEIWGKVRRRFKKEPDPSDEGQVSEVAEILKELVENGEIHREDISFILNNNSFTPISIRSEENVVKNAEINNSIVGKNISINELKVYKGNENKE